MSDSCIFCSIAIGKAPASVVFEDDELIAFMTLRATRPGEFLIVPKKHVDHFCDIADDLSARIMLEAQKYSRIIRQRLDAPRVGLIVNGFGVAHAHLIVVPLHEECDIISQRHAYLEDGQIKYNEDRVELVARDERDKMAQLLGAGDGAEVSPMKFFEVEMVPAVELSAGRGFIYGRKKGAWLPRNPGVWAMSGREVSKKAFGEMFPGLPPVPTEGEDSSDE